MQRLYRIVVTMYGYDTWDIFTENKDFFTQMSTFWSVDQAIDFFGQEGWETLSDNYIFPHFPYILLGETTVRQYD